MKTLLNGSRKIGRPRTKHACTYADCGKVFKNAQGLRMHIGRAHTKSIRIPKHRKRRQPTAPRPPIPSGPKVSEILAVNVDVAIIERRCPHCNEPIKLLIKT